MKIKDLAISYHIVNLIFSFIIAIIFVYSLIFYADTHPIPAMLTETTGIVPPSKGLSSSFSEIIRGNFYQSLTYNPHGIRVFSFFALQLLLRIMFSLLVKLKGEMISRIVLIDTVVSIILFLGCFAPFIAYILELFKGLF
jgi:hypothetical protein